MTHGWANVGAKVKTAIVKIWTTDPNNEKPSVCQKHIVFMYVRMISGMYYYIIVCVCLFMDVYCMFLQLYEYVFYVKKIGGPESTRPKLLKKFTADDTTRPQRYQFTFSLVIAHSQTAGALALACSMLCCVACVSSSRWPFKATSWCRPCNIPHRSHCRV